MTIILCATSYLEDILDTCMIVKYEIELRLGNHFMKHGDIKICLNSMD